MILCYSQLSNPAINLSWGEQWNWKGNSACRRSCVQSCSYGTGTGCSGFEWHWLGWLQARHCDGLRDMALRGQGLSAPEEISLMRHNSCPQQWPLSPQCHVSVTGSCWIWSSAVPGSWEHLPGDRILLISILVFRRLILQTAAELLPKGFQLRENEMLWSLLVKAYWFLGHQVKMPKPVGTLCSLEAELSSPGAQDKKTKQRRPLW